MNANVKFRVAKSKFVQGVIFFFAFIITLPLILIIIYIFKEGITKINWAFLTQIPKPVGEAGQLRHHFRIDVLQKPPGFRKFPQADGAACERVGGPSGQAGARAERLDG